MGGAAALTQLSCSNLEARAGSSTTAPEGKHCGEGEHDLWRRLDLEPEAQARANSKLVEDQRLGPRAAGTPLSHPGVGGAGVPVTLGRFALGSG